MSQKNDWSAAVKLGGAMGLYWPAMWGDKKEKEKTPRELESERDKWMKQTEMAQVVILDVSQSLSIALRQVAALQEEQRLAKLSEENTLNIITLLTEEKAKLRDKVTALEEAAAKANAAAAETPKSE